MSIDTWVDEAAPSVTLRDPNEIMQPERLRTLPPTRLSASRALINRMIRERWQIEAVRFEIDERARGQALYRIRANDRVFEFIVFSFEPKLEGRTGRIIGTNWDMMGSLVEGETSPEDWEQTLLEFPKLYAGRATPGTLVWCRSNRSLRAFEHVVASLASMEQPDVEELWRIGYLMRNTGLDGNGTFGTRSFLALESDHPLRAPYHAQMLAAYMMREFAFDLVEHLAKARNPAAARLDPRIKRFLGLGNGSALGLVFFINNHPWLLERWLTLRETALALAGQQRLAAGNEAANRLLALLGRAIVYHEQDPFTYDVFASPGEIAVGLRCARELLLDMLARSGGELLLADYTSELEDRIDTAALEVVHALSIELIPETVDQLLEQQAAAELLVRRPEMSIGELRDILTTEYAWALQIDLRSDAARRYVWYKSIDAEEPRRGPRDEVPEGFNWALDLPGHVQRLDRMLAQEPEHGSVGEFLVRHPEERTWVQRIQGLRGHHFHSPHMNMLDEDFIPVNVIRLINSAFHGLDKTVDSLNRNVLGLLFHGAPAREDLMIGAIDIPFYPMRPEL